MRKHMKRFMAGLATGVCTVCAMNSVVQADELEKSNDIRLEEVSSISDESVLPTLGIVSDEDGYLFGEDSYPYCYAVEGCLPGADESVALWLLANTEDISFEDAAKQYMGQEKDSSFRVFYVETKSEKERAMEKWTLPVGSLRWGMTQEEAELSVKLFASQDEDGEERVLESPCEVYQQEMTVTLRFFDYDIVDYGLAEIYGTYAVQEYGDLAETITALFGEPYSEGENEYYKQWVWQSELVSAFYSEDYVRECYEPIVSLLEEDTFESMIKTRMVVPLATITVREDSEGAGSFEMKYSMWQLLENE
ncbi:MAG: hypothetical protein LUH00_08590 [Lachnospiraceae bacterium]|nr:hypothetical protein [Lachnospiraceae bacterium]